MECAVEVNEAQGVEPLHPDSLTAEAARDQRLDGFVAKMKVT